MGKYQVLWSLFYRRSNDFFASMFYSHFDVVDEFAFLSSGVSLLSDRIWVDNWVKQVTSLTKHLLYVNNLSRAEIL